VTQPSNTPHRRATREAELVTLFGRLDRRAAGALLTILEIVRNSLDRDHRNQSIAITETGRWRSPKPAIAIGGRTNPVMTT
jgi:DNA-binding transcriptional ArsR family regulator